MMWIRSCLFTAFILTNTCNLSTYNYQEICDVSQSYRRVKPGVVIPGMKFDVSLDSCNQAVTSQTVIVLGSYWKLNCTNDNKNVKVGRRFHN